MRRSVRLLAVWVCLVGFWAGDLRAQEKAAAPQAPPEKPRGFGTDRFRIRPSFRVEEWWDSNIYLAPSGEADDSITILAPKLDVEYMGKSFLIRTGYQARAEFFRRHAGEDAVEHYANFQAAGKWKQFSAGVSDNFAQTEDPLDIDLARRLQVMSNTASGRFRVDWNKIGVEASYTHALIQFEQDFIRYFNHETQTFRLSGYYKLGDKTDLIVDGDYGLVTYGRTVKDDLDFWRLRAGLRGELTSKITADFRLGWKGLYYHQGTGSERSSDSNNISAQGTFNWAVTERADG